MYAHEARVLFHHRLIGETTKGREGGKGGGGEKKRTEGQGRVWRFRFYGRLTHCLWGLIFVSPLRARHGGASSPFSPRVSSCVFLLAVPPTSFVARPSWRIQAHDARDNACLSSLWNETVCTMRQQSGAAPLSAGSLSASPHNYFLFFPCVFLIFFFSVFFFIQYP